MTRTRPTARGARTVPTARGALVALALAAGCGGDSPAAPNAAVVDVAPDAMLLVGVGDGASFSAAARDADGNLVGGAPSWSVSDPAVASISDRGFASALAGGEVVVTATIGGASGTARLEVYVPREVSRYVPGERYYGRRDYVEYVPGELPLVLSSAHGGARAPAEIPERGYGVVINDRNSLELTLAMRQALIDLTGSAPHVVLAHLHRSRLDANREIMEAAQGSPYAEQAWREFHDWIETARATVAGDFGKGLYLDVHGHGHEIDRIELGYLLGADELNRPDQALNSLEVVARTSIRDLGRTSPIPFSQLLRGPASLGGMLADEGVASVPSPAAPGPGSAPYFRGGYNTRRYGSVSDGDVVSGVQLEHHYRGIRDTPENRREYAAGAARAIRRFMIEHYGFFEAAPARSSQPVQPSDAAGLPMATAPQPAAASAPPSAPRPGEHECDA